MLTTLITNHVVRFALLYAGLTSGAKLVTDCPTSKKIIRLAVQSDYKHSRKSLAVEIFLFYKKIT